jgi:hypothetical protein
LECHPRVYFSFLGPGFFKETLTLRTATKTEKVRSKLADLLTTARKVTMQTAPSKTSKERLHDSGITPDLINTLGCEINTIFTEDGMAVAHETLEFTSPTDGPPKLYIARKHGRAILMRISRAISIYLRHAIKAYDSLEGRGALLVDGSLPDSNLELLNHTLANIAPPTAQSRPQQGHEAQEVLSNPIETCENATDTRQKWSKIQKEEIHRRKDLQQQFRQKRAQK